MPAANSTTPATMKTIPPTIGQKKQSQQQQQQQHLEIYPLTVHTPKFTSFDLFEDLLNTTHQNNIKIENGDIIIISSKYISNSQGRTLDLKKVKPYPNSKAIAAKYHMSQTLTEVIQRESDQIFGGIAGFIMATIDNILAPNAGIDKSNAKKGKVVLYPNNPYQTLEHLRRKIFLKYTVNTGIIAVDSRLMPARIGTVGVAIACAGIEPTYDQRSQKDLGGNPLKVTIQAVADSFATIANHVMGEGAESRPYVIIKKSGIALTTRQIQSNEITIPHQQCVYMRSLQKKK